jgi:hypothetical protein
MQSPGSRRLLGVTKGTQSRLEDVSEVILLDSPSWLNRVGCIKGGQTSSSLLLC